MKLTINDRAILNNGIGMPYFGLGTYKITSHKEATTAVAAALEKGYRLIDTARMYNNEKYIGAAVRASGIPREDIFITTKLWTNEHGKNNTLRAFNDSLKQLNTDYVDLFLIHWPDGGKRIETWKAMEELLAQEKCKAIGVSNFAVKHINELLDNCSVVPAVDQVEFSPFLYQKDLLVYCVTKGIQLEAYSPLGRGNKVKDLLIDIVAKKYSKSPAQILIRWALQHKIIVIPKSADKQRIIENADVFDFEITEEDMNYLNMLNTNYRLAADPEKIE